MDVWLVMNVEHHFVLPAIFAQKFRQRLYKAHCDRIAFRHINRQFRRHGALKAVGVHIGHPVRKESTAQQSAQFHLLHPLIEKQPDQRAQIFKIKCIGGTACNTGLVQFDIEHRLMDAPHGAGVAAYHFIKSRRVLLQAMAAADRIKAEPVCHGESILWDLYVIYPYIQPAAIASHPKHRRICTGCKPGTGTQAQIQCCAPILRFNYTVPGRFEAVVYCKRRQPGRVKRLTGRTLFQNHRAALFAAVPGVVLHGYSFHTKEFRHKRIALEGCVQLAGICFEQKLHARPAVARHCEPQTLGKMPHRHIGIEKFFPPAECPPVNALFHGLPPKKRGPSREKPGPRRVYGVFCFFILP